MIVNTHFAASLLPNLCDYIKCLFLKKFTLLSRDMKFGTHFMRPEVFRDFTPKYGQYYGWSPPQNVLVYPKVTIILSYTTVIPLLSKAWLQKILKSGKHYNLRQEACVQSFIKPKTSRESQNAALRTSHRLSNVSNCYFQTNWGSKLNKKKFTVVIVVKVVRKIMQPLWKKFQLQNFSYKIWVTKFELQNFSYTILFTRF